ncbi:hypothetical protein BH10PAT3_BH10PAT3_2080 [soil metagenome]
MEDVLYEAESSDAMLPDESEVSYVLSRRDLIMKGVKYIAVAAVAFDVGAGAAYFTKDNSTGAPKDDEASYSSSSDAATAFKETGKSSEPKAEYSLEDLVRYVSSTEFSEPSPSKWKDAASDILSSPSLDEAKGVYKNAMLAATGRNVLFNIDPATGKQLLNTRADPSPMEYGKLLANMYLMVGTLPKAVTKTPTDYYIIEDYLPDKTPGEGITTVNAGIGGMSHNYDNTHLLIEYYSVIDSPSYFMHEFTHIAESLIDKYEEDSTYAGLRKDAIDRYGDIEQMLVHLQDIAPSLTWESQNLANLLVMDYGAGLNPKLEDAAYTISNTIEKGYLPTSDDPLLQILRMKQIQAVADLSQVTGVDIGATIEYIRRFGSEMHPMTLNSIAQSGVLQYTSPIERSALGNRPDWQTGSSPAVGSHFINIGNADKPEIIVLNAFQANKDNSGMYTEATGYFELCLGIDNIITPLDLGEAPPPTTESTLTEPSGALYLVQDPHAQSVIKRFAPGLAATGNYQANDASNDFTISAETDPSIRNYVITIESSALWETIDQSRIVGTIGEDGLYKAA